jgi:hypothetical protein
MLNEAEVVRKQVLMAANMKMAASGLLRRVVW